MICIATVPSSFVSSASTVGSSATDSVSESEFDLRSSVAVLTSRVLVSSGAVAVSVVHTSCSW